MTKTRQPYRTLTAAGLGDAKARRIVSSREGLFLYTDAGDWYRWSVGEVSWERVTWDVAGPRRGVTTIDLASDDED